MKPAWYVHNMKPFILFIAIGLLLIVLVVGTSLINSGNGNNITFVPGQNQTDTERNTGESPFSTMEQTASPSAKNLDTRLTSSVFENNEPIPAKYTCDGQNINPPLTLSNVSADAVSLALSVRDPDAVSGTFTHWVVWNIDPKTTRVVERATIPGATHGTNDSGRTGYTGPCPPSGVHSYIFTLYSLDSKINLTRTAKYEEFQKAIQNHVLEQTQLIGLYTHAFKLAFNAQAFSYLQKYNDLRHPGNSAAAEAPRINSSH